MTDARRRAIGHGLAIAGLLYAAWVYLVVGDNSWQRHGADALVYYAVDPANPYRGSTVGGINAYLYSPAFAQLFLPFTLLPPQAFVFVYSGLLAAIALWLARPWPLALLVLALPVSQEILIGNIHLLLAAAVVVGFRWPAAWAFILLTKVTPGIALLWFVVRREWRSLAIALGATVLIAGVSFLVAAGPWFEWLALLRRDGGQEATRLLIRLALAAVLVTWGAWRDQAWTVPLAAMLGLPVVWSDSFSMLLGCVALAGWRSRPGSVAVDAAPPARAPVSAKV